MHAAAPHHTATRWVRPHLCARPADQALDGLLHLDHARAVAACGSSAEMAARPAARWGETTGPPTGGWHPCHPCCHPVIALPRLTAGVGRVVAHNDLPLGGAAAQGVPQPGLVADPVLRFGAGTWEDERREGEARGGVRPLKCHECTLPLGPAGSSQPQARQAACASAGRMPACSARHQSWRSRRSCTNLATD